MPVKKIRHSDKSKEHVSKGFNPHYRINEREFNDAIRKVERQMLTLDFSEMEDQSQKIAERLRCSCCKTLPASLRLLECIKCASVICLHCNDKMLERVFGESESDDGNDIIDEQSREFTRNINQGQIPSN